MTRFIVIPSPGDVPPASQIGGKAHNLARLAAVPDIAVPPWFVIGAAAFDHLVLAPGDPMAAGAADAPADLRARIAALPLPDALAAELRAALHARGLVGRSLAVRSSASAEDAHAASFAGQFTTVLGVVAGDDLDALWDAVKTVWSSAFSDHALAYARDQRSGDALRMAVIVQELAAARAAGVAFSIDPVSGDPDVAVVSAVHGLGETLVSGESDADTFRVRFRGDAIVAVEASAAEKQVALLADGRRVDVPRSLATALSITEAQARDIALATRAIANAFGTPQDIEWAVGSPAGSGEVSGPTETDRLHIVQARPVTAAGTGGRGERRLWDNSNIVESYGGVTTPLTFSFARTVYEDVYRQFCRVLGVSETAIDAHRTVFANMLGLIQGRVYYNLLNWYRVLALLPGYQLNREFMERMMGVRERLADPPPPPGTGERSRDAWRLLRTVGGLVRESNRLDREVAAFFARVNRALEPVEQADLDRWPADDLVALYRRLEGELLHHWRPPLVNDFFAMIWFGVLGRLVERWLPDAEPTLVNDLLVGEGGIISTEPARRVMALAGIVAASEPLRALFEREPDDSRLLTRLRADAAHAHFACELDAYLRRFGDRCVGELKLETITPSEDPAFVIRMVRAYAAQGQTDAARGTASEEEVRRAAESYVRSHLGGAKRLAFLAVLRRARSRIRDRENLRFERTRVFGAVRRIFRGLGLRLHEQRRLQHPRDVFYLTVDEIFAAVGGTGVTTDLAALATLRRAEFERFESLPAPPDRFETRGLPTAPTATTTANAAAHEGDLQGLGCCPGVVRAPVRIVHDPMRAASLAGHILVAERTDPGWTLLFPTALGLLVQRGSLLSHSAIVAREVGLPCVVGIPRLIETLCDGEWVEMDGTTGVVRRIDAPEAAA